MHFRTLSPRRRRVLAAALLAAGAQLAPAQPPAPGTADGLSLPQAFEAAWSRQPQAQALALRREAAAARQRAARAWTAEPPTLELAARTDRLNRNSGTREYEAGLSVPLWLPHERSRNAALAEAEAAALESQTRAARLSLAATLRESWWAWHRARVEAEAARDQLDSARRLAADVERRLAAGDMARADRHQAEGAVALAESNLAQAQAGATAAWQQLAAAAGFAGTPATASESAEAEPASEGAGEHAALAELRDRVAAAEHAASLAAARSRANPELTLATTRERGAFGESYAQTVTLGVRVPFGGGARHHAQVALAQAEAAQARAQLGLEQQRLAAGREAARSRVESARVQLAAALRRAQLARESRGFFDKSFRLGETDLPTRLRIEAEAAEADRQAARSRIELAAALSAWRQALGLLPQ
jgi:cobalt-zinc-cadmium efflux system outer membrane protein